VAYVDVTSVQAATFGTHSHGEETLAERGGVVPAQLKWSDLHPPGVKVLPKGSPPAGAGEINWEDTLGGKFALALEQLEGLLYAMFGSRPAAYNMSGTWRKCQWYDRVHPRCLWGPETWERQIITGLSGCNETGNCYDYQPNGKEYAALGENPPCCPLPKPSVPIRSRSGDPAAQYLRGVHDAAYFPAGSVTRDFATGTFDPEGYGWFGATQPGRNDAGSNPWLATANGYTQKAGQAVKFYWTKPDGVDTPTSVTLYYQLKAPGGAWGSWQNMAMTLTSGKYEAQLDAQPHGTECRWYIRYYLDGDPDVTRYDPGGGAAPADDEAYYFQWFTHFNPYANGLPELLTDYGGVDVRHGTDHYEFDGSEAIQPELINLARWVLSWLGGDCCTGEYETCAETDERCDYVHHNPRLRGTSHGICCIPMPIRFRWSGSNSHPHYVTGGKAGTHGARPLHNRDEDAGSAAARKTWRGINMLYAGDGTTFDNPFYGGGYSWGTAPGTFILMYEPEHETLATVFAKYPRWGLRAGDVIEAVHLQEIVDAVAYLVDYGVWTTTPICTHKRTPPTGKYLGETCGKTHSYEYNSTSGTAEVVTEDWCNKCCDGCGGYKEWWYWNGELDYYYEDPEGGPFYCTAFAQPSWEDCWSECPSERCWLEASKTSACAWYETDGHTTKDKTRATDCDAAQGYCGYATRSRICYPFDYGPPEADEFYSQGTTAQAKGWSAYVCTPPACTAGGFDDDHGSAWDKRRVDHTWNSGLSPVNTGPPGGNCYGDIHLCGDDENGLPVAADFAQVIPVQFDGLAQGWFDWAAECSAASSCWDGWDDPAPDVPGLGLHEDDGDPLCTFTWHGTGPTPFKFDSQACDCTQTFPVCSGTAAWVAVDLNLDGTGTPYRAHGEGYTGRGVPRLRNYDLTKDPETVQHSCPCETWTGATPCALT